MGVLFLGGGLGGSFFLGGGTVFCLAGFGFRFVALVMLFSF